MAHHSEGHSGKDLHYDFGLIEPTSVPRNYDEENEFLSRFDSMQQRSSPRHKQGAHVRPAHDASRSAFERSQSSRTQASLTRIEQDLSGNLGPAFPHAAAASAKKSSTGLKKWLYMGKKVSSSSSVPCAEVSTGTTGAPLASDTDAEDKGPSPEQLSSLWKQEILPNWDKKRSSKKTRELVWLGLPPNVRGMVWLRCKGNHMNITRDLYAVLLEESKSARTLYFERKQQMDEADGDVGGRGGLAENFALFRTFSSQSLAGVTTKLRDLTCLKAIQADLPRTFPELTFYRASDSVHRIDLRDVLECFVCFRPQIGYAQGMNYVVGMLLLYVADAFDAFVLFVGMLEADSMLLCFFTMNERVPIYLSLFDALLAEELPELSAHFGRECIRTDMFLISFVMTMFSRSLPLDSASLFFDQYFFDGEVVIFRAALAVLKVKQSVLIQMCFEGMADTLTSPLDISPQIFSQGMQSIRLSSSRFREKFEHVSKRTARAHSKSEVRRASSPRAALRSDSGRTGSTGSLNRTVSGQSRTRQGSATLTVNPSDVALALERNNLPLSPRYAAISPRRRGESSFQ
ncbi:TBC1 domain family member 12 [Porphyridium purpureum]|uniref:TBC1 domain family member 12 n=1 Tax=Porphyridium purpureum TaxID=35688 RepID=A0A5J4YNV0_PORPP|nr:TBC1 domain family member 12 [Porphyridium purpureum]|eukprot:POR1177..scf295_9